MTARFLLLMAFVGLTTSPVVGQFVSGSDGSDGAFNPLPDVEVGLSLPGGGSAIGTYDPAGWAVIFDYTTIDILPGSHGRLVRPCRDASCTQRPVAGKLPVPPCRVVQVMTGFSVHVVEGAIAPRAFLEGAETWRG